MENNLQSLINQINLPEREYKISLPNIIIRNTYLQNLDNNYENLRSFLLDVIEFLKIEIAHTKKYSPEVYHSNVSRSREDDLNFARQLLSLIQKP